MLFGQIASAYITVDYKRKYKNTLPCGSLRIVFRLYALSVFHAFTIPTNQAKRETADVFVSVSQTSPNSHPPPPKKKTMINFMFSKIYLFPYYNPLGYNFSVGIIFKSALQFTWLLLFLSLVFVEFSPLHSHASFNFRKVLQVFDNLPERKKVQLAEKNCIRTISLAKDPEFEANMLY